MRAKFTKAHGLGNDMIIFDGVEEELLAKKIVFLCDRKYGVGGDCVILCSETVKFWNADGSEAKLCGNGCRCLVKYLYQKYGQKSCAFMTDSGLVEGHLTGDGVSIKYPVNPTLYVKDGYYFVNLGNKHVVIFGDGDSIEDHLENFDLKNVNVMFLKEKLDEWFMGIYEAGVGETNACGSGAMAASIAIWTRDHHQDKIVINMKGGVLEMSRQGDDFYQRGAAELVFEGEIDLGL